MIKTRTNLQKITAGQEENNLYPLNKKSLKKRNTKNTQTARQKEVIQQHHYLNIFIIYLVKRFDGRY